MQYVFIVTLTLYLSSGGHAWPEGSQVMGIREEGVLDQRNMSSNTPRNINYRAGSMTTTRTAGSDGRIIFPQDDPSSSFRYFNPQPAPACVNSTFCEEAEGYPQDLIRNSLKTRSDLDYLASVDTAESFIGQRFGDRTVDVCSSHVTVVYPKTAQNRNKKWHYVVNQNEFIQGIRVERCAQHDGACRIVEEALHGYQSICQQKFASRLLAAVADSGNIRPQTFDFPVSCCCQLKAIGRRPFPRIDDQFSGDQQHNQTFDDSSSSPSLSDETF